MDIRNDRDLRDAYIMVLAFTRFIEQAKREDREIGNSEQTVKDLKRGIRAYLKAEDSGRTLVKDYGIDGYIVRFEMPDTDDPEAWFDNNERLRMRYSAYDCTGQAFTQWHAFKTLGGRKVCYHSIAFDV